MSKVLTGALALIKVNGITVGKMKDIQFTERIQRGEVQGIGELHLSEAPATKHSGSLSCSFYSIDYSETGLPGATNRKATSIKELVDTLLLQEDGLDVVIFKKVTDVIDPSTGQIRSKPQVYATVRKCFITEDGMNVSEGSIASQRQQFIFLDPIIFPI